MNDVPRLIGGGRTGLSTYELYLETVPEGDVPLTLAQWLDGQAATGEARTQALDAADTATTQAGIASGAAGTATTAAGTATTAATTAATQAGIATTQAGAATGAATAALTYRDQSQAAATGAQVAAADSAGVYPGTAAALAVTDVGAQFRVLTPLGEGVIQYRHDAGPVATELLRGPTLGFLNTSMENAGVAASAPARLLRAFHYDGFEPPHFAVADADGNAAFGIDAAGKFFTQGLGTVGSRAFHYADDLPAIAFVDEAGRAFLRFDAEGQPIGVGADASLVGRVDDLEGGVAELDASVEALVNTGLPGLASVPTSSEGVASGAPWADRRALRFAPPYSSLYTSSAGTIIPNHLALYALYDGLMANHPDYITRTKLGEDGEANDIFQYAFAPPALLGASVTPAEKAKPKIVYVTGLHGFEKGSQIVTFAFFKEMCEDWRNREMLYHMRWGVDFIVVPAMTPSSIDLNTRKNANGVDVNRNFPTAWSEGSDDPTSIYYRGPSAGSEPETQIAMQLALDHPDACALIDHHMSSSFTSQNFAMWVGAGQSKARAIIMPYLQDMNAYLRSEFASFAVLPEGTAFSRVTDSIAGSSVRQWEQGSVPSYLLETPTGGGFDTTLAARRHNAEAQRHFVWAVYQNEIKRRQLAALIGV